MSAPFVLLDLQVSDDATPVRHVVSRAARGLGFGATDVTRLGTAVSEIARLAVSCGPTRVVLETTPADGDAHVLHVRFTPAGDGWRTVLDDGRVPTGPLQRLVELTVTDDSLTVSKGGTAPLTTLELTALRHRLLADGPGDLRSALESQNTELLGALGTLLDREAELVRLNDELEQTNRGVVALYAELERRATEIRTAQRAVFVELERALRPSPLLVEGLELDVRYLPAQVNSPTGGDLYDWVVLPDGTLHVAVVDVLGHGVTSTRDALRVTHTLRTLVQEGYPLGDVLRRADALLQLPGRPVYATALLARIDPDSGRVQLAGAGHPPALLLAQDGSVRYVEAPGRPLGYPDGGSGEVAELDLAADDCLLLYTDGLIEVRHDIVEGLETLETAAIKALPLAVPQLLDTVLAACLRGDVLRDDTLLLGLRWRRADPRAPREALGVRLPSTSDAPAMARQYLLERASDLSSTTVDDALVMLSEVVGNAVRHGAPPVGLRLRVDAGAVRVDVTDGGDPFDHDATVLPGRGRATGRGLFLVNALARSWGVESGTAVTDGVGVGGADGGADGAGKTVWFEI